MRDKVPPNKRSLEHLGLHQIHNDCELRELYQCLFFHRNNPTKLLPETRKFHLHQQRYILIVMDTV